MEAGMETQAMGVLEELVLCDDESVEGWYLGGWCALLMTGRGRVKEAEEGSDEMEEEKEEPRSEEERHALLITSREWLRNSLRLYEVLEYQDERLSDHARELVEELDKELGEIGDDEEGEGDEEWEDDDAEEGEYDNDGEEFNGVRSEGEDEEMNRT